MKPELVGKVRRDLQSAWTDSKDPDSEWWTFMARYALALAERSAREALALAEGDGGSVSTTKTLLSAWAVERAVETGS